MWHHVSSKVHPPESPSELPFPAPHISLRFFSGAGPKGQGTGLLSLWPITSARSVGSGGPNPHAAIE